MKHEQEWVRAMIDAAEGRAELPAELEAQIDDLLADNDDWSRQCVAALAEDEPSLAWRSQLNERLRAHAPKVRRPFWAWAWRPASVTAVAAVMGVALLFQMGTFSGPVDNGLGDELVQWHRDTETAFELVGVGVVGSEVALNSAPAYDDEYRWDLIDLDLF